MLTILERNNIVYLQHGGGNFFRLDDVNFISCIVLFTRCPDVSSLNCCVVALAEEEKLNPRKLKQNVAVSSSL